ncbi:phage gp6-like head-tail connector protein [Clostridium botulinum]|nr:MULTISPECIES: head-tail connector protein [unclassified Clostridium]NFH99469.1 phage gp6-like head-tail connector protein [Clostridium botulinum]NFI62196.1 phage gp6-like head-tail connector protein [Clostridium botulinum]NFJ42598.1 phage gp6-like head-tail connector protein [Clostridium botulinum]NFJ46531.1 phage gp6-like head-tail connector protein [Clostridium botulinum]NFK26427.1 phage gp6-like head-tail connector protein [Clostridium botulinum]
MERVVDIKINEVKTELLVNYCNAYDEDKQLLEIFKDASVDYIKSYTGLTDEEINNKNDLTIALLVLVSGMFDSRSIEADKTNINLILDSILGLHSRNLV